MTEYKVEFWHKFSPLLSTTDPSTHALPKAVRQGRPGSPFCVLTPGWGMSFSGQSPNFIHGDFTISCPVKLPWAFSFVCSFSKPWMLYWKYAYITLFLHNNTKQYNHFCKLHIERKATHHPFPALPQGT